MIFEVNVKSTPVSDFCSIYLITAAFEKRRTGNTWSLLPPPAVRIPVWRRAYLGRCHYRRSR